MNKIEKIVLIDGVFIHKDAKDILTSVLSTKINFHRLKNFSSQERLGKDDEVAQNRIFEIKKEMKKLEKILCEAHEKNKKLIVSADINITLIDD